MQLQLPHLVSKRHFIPEGSPKLSRSYPHPVGGTIKRALDVSVALTALVFFSPLFLLVVLLLKIADPGPAFFRHRRVGFEGCMFDCLKFRTMICNGDEILARYLSAFPDAAHEWQSTRKLKNDPRVTVVGHVLRQLSLDELPQLWNVVRGDMSIVGPRPIVPDEIRLYGSSAVHYFRARPGITGAWQVSGRNHVSYRQRVSLDRQYVENWSLRNDFIIILKTIPAVITHRGTY
jgi:exopolysaccharide production protein ExoY